MKDSAPVGGLSILELPTLVTSLFDRAHRQLLPGAVGPVGLFVRYLRRKPGRGLSVIYHVDELGRPGRRTHSTPPGRSICLALTESALVGSHLRLDVAQVQQAVLDSLPSGVLSLSDAGLTVQAFPADAGLPALAASCDVAQNSPLFRALESAAQRQVGQPAWNLSSATAEPVRYKPASRCVIRYHLAFERPGTGGPTSGQLTLYGKVYADPHQAQAVFAVQQELYQEQLHDGKG